MKPFQLIFIFLLFLTACRPSANLNDYKSYRFQANNTDSIPPGKVKVTFLGVATLLIDDGETQLLTDGFVTRPHFVKIAFGKIGSDTVLVKSVIHQLGINRLKAIFTAHSHYDHAMDAPNMALFNRAHLYGSSSTLNIGRGAGLPESEMSLYKPGKSISIGQFTVTILRSKHTPGLKLLGGGTDEGQEIKTPLHQPANLKAYAEGGTYNILVQHGGHSLLIKASTNFIPGALDSVKADVLFLGVATLSKQDSTFRNRYYAETVDKVNPKIIIPVHWDNFFQPLSDNLKPYPGFVDNVKSDFDFLIGKTSTDNIPFRIMQGYESVLLF